MPDVHEACSIPSCCDDHQPYLMSIIEHLGGRGKKINFQGHSRQHSEFKTSMVVSE